MSQAVKNLMDCFGHPAPNLDLKKRSKALIELAAGRVNLQQMIFFEMLKSYN